MVPGNSWTITAGSHTALVGVGESATQALGVGVVIEQAADIVAAIELSVAYADIVRVYSNLLAGSEHHLAAFLKVLEGSEPEAAGMRMRGR
jgi:hypothetical protein